MRRAGLLALILAVVALPVPAARAAAPGLAAAANARFPDRSFVLTLPKARNLADGDVTVRENGRAIHGVDLVASNSAAAGRFGVVLAIDNSKSMRGAKLRGALRAARTLVAHRTADQPVAVVAFAGQVHVIVPFTTDPVAIDNGLSSITIAGGGSRILDGAAEAVALIRAAHMTSGAAVILSDGGDNHSRETLAQLTTAATAAGARLFAVGLGSHGRNFATLNALAAGSGAEFSTAASLDDLARVYGRLGSRLAHQYVIEYRSPAAPGRRVSVTVTVAGLSGVARASYRSPALVGPTRPPFHRSPFDMFWAQGGSALLVALIVALLCGAALWVVLRPRVGTLRTRMAAFVSAADATGGGEERDALGDRLLRSADRSLDDRAWWVEFKERMDVAQVRIAPARLLGLVTAATLFLLVLAPLATGFPPLGLLAFAVPVGVKATIEYRARKERKLFSDQLPDNLQVIASALRAGHSFTAALAVMVEDAQEPTRRELQRVITDERLGVPLDSALGVVVRRMDSRDLAQVSLVSSLQRETGGNTAEVLDQVVQTVRERMELERLVKTLTMQGRLTRGILTALPLGLLLYLTVTNGKYVAPLYGTTGGRIALAMAVGMVCTAWYVITKIIDIKV